jgi:hypothetical protein
MYESEPTWDPDRHLERVYRRGTRLRRRRRAALVSLPTAAVVLVGILVIGGSTSRVAGPVQVAQGDTHSTAPADDAQSKGGAHASSSADSEGLGPGVDGATGSTSSAQGASTGSTGRGPTGPTASGAADGSGSHAAPGAKTGAPSGDAQPGSADHGGSGPPPASTAAPNTGGSPCDASALSYSTTTDRSKYGPGQSVTIFLVVRNRSSKPCQGPGPCGIGPWASVANASGAVVWQSQPIAVACVNPPPQPPELQPGQSATYQAGTWNREVCAASGSCSSQAPPGTYRAVAHRGDVSASGTRFSIS